MTNKLISMSSSDYISSTIVNNFFNSENAEESRSVSELKNYLLKNLGPLSKSTESVILLALNDWTANYNDQVNPLTVLQHLVIFSKDSELMNKADIHEIALTHRDRSEEFAVKVVTLDQSGKTLFIGSIWNRAYITIIVADSGSLTASDKDKIQNELAAFNHLIQNLYETLQPFRAGALPE